MKILSLACKLFFREYRAGAFNIILIALITAVAALTSIHFYTDRVGRAFDQQSARLLGADLLIKRSSPIPKPWFDYAKNLSLHTTQILIFPTMMAANGKLQLVNAKAIEANYPLRGTLKITDVSSSIPRVGEIWVDKRLFNLLQLKINSTVQIGAASFAVTHVILQEPDINANWLNIAPRIILNSADVAKTQVIQPGSRIEYQFAIAGSTQALKNIKHWIKKQISVDQEIIDTKNGRPQLSNIFQHATSYLNLVSLICVILCGVAIATTAYRYTQKQLDVAGILRCLGVTQRQLSCIYLTQLFILGIIGSAMGCIAGYFLQSLFPLLFASWFKIHLPHTSVMPVYKGFMSGIILLLCFSLPAFFNLRNIAPLRVLRRELKMHSINLLWYVFAAILLIFIAFIYTKDLRLVIFFFSGLLITLVLLGITSHALLKFTHLLSSPMRSAWKYGLINLSHNPLNTHIQLLSFGVIFMIMVLLVMVRNDLFENWLTQLPPNSPNYFVINILPHEVTKFSSLVKENEIQSAKIYPIVRGRLITLNDMPIKAAVPKSARSNNALNRELNLTNSMLLPQDNQILRGQWWNENEADKNYVSIESRLANSLHIHLEDKLGFQIGDQQINVIVKNIRSVNWDSFKPNFYMIFPDKILDKLPKTYMTSIYLPSEKQLVLNKMIEQFPSISLIDVNMIINEARTLIEKVTWALQFVLLFSLFASALVFYAALQNSLYQRLNDCSILRILGASNAYLRIMLMSEFIYLGLLSGFLGGVAASITSILLAEQIFTLKYQLNYSLCFITAIIGAILIGGIGTFATRKILRYSPAKILQII